MMEEISYEIYKVKADILQQNLFFWTGEAGAHSLSAILRTISPPPLMTCTVHIYYKQCNGIHIGIINAGTVIFVMYIVPNKCFT